VSEARRLHPASLIARSLQVLPQMLAGGAGYAAVIQREGFARILMFAGIAAGIGVVAALLSWWRFRYTVGDSEIVIESGVLHRQRRVIPFERVQDIAIERPLLARLFGTARVKVETGGSASDEGKLDMIAVAEAEALRDRIRRWHAGAGDAPAEVASAAPLLFAMDVPRVLFAGLFNFSLVFLAAIFAVIQYLDEFNLVEMEQWFSEERAEQASTLVSIRAALGLLVILVALGVVAGVARTLARDFGFRLTRTEKGMRRRRGLFTLTEVVIPIRRIQVALIESGPVTRRLGWHSLSFQTLGADQKEGGVQVAAPFARLEEIAPIVEEAAFPMPPERGEFRRLPRRALVRWALPWVGLGMIGVGAAVIVEPRAGISAALMFLFALIGGMRWRKHSWALDGRALFVTGGFLKRRTYAIPFEKAQSISLTQGPVQRRLGLASLLVDTAGASMFRAPEIVDLEAEEAEALHARLLSLFYEGRAEWKKAA
jgi:putative membrane protein